MLVVSSKIERIIKVNEVNNELTLLTLWELFKKKKFKFHFKYCIKIKLKIITRAIIDREYEKRERERERNWLDRIEILKVTFANSAALLARPQVEGCTCHL